MLPSDVIRLEGDYERFCFDEACSQFLYYLNDEKEPNYPDSKEHEFEKPSDMYREFAEQFNVEIKQKQ